MDSSVTEIFASLACEGRTDSELAPERHGFSSIEAMACIR